jgi:hypothetical protein
MSDTLIFTFARMNPPTQGHEELVNRIKQEAGKRKADSAVYLSRTKDRHSNPIEYREKIRYAQSAFGPVVKFAGGKTVLEILSSLSNKYDNIVFMVGQDRVSNYRDLLNRSNGKSFNFDNINVIGVGKDEDELSAAQARDFAHKGEWEQFAQTIASGLSDAEKKRIFNTIRKARGSKSEVKKGSKAVPKEWKGKMLWKMTYTLNGRKADKVVATRAAGNAKDATAVLRKDVPSATDIKGTMMGIHEANIMTLRKRHSREKQRLDTQHQRERENRKQEKERMKARHDANMDRARTVRTDKINDSVIIISDEDIELFLEFIDYDRLDAETFPMIEDFEVEMDEERKPLTVLQRLKRGRVMKVATPDKLHTRSRKAAIKLLRKKFAGKLGANYAELSASQKKMVDGLVAKKAGMLDRISRKMLPKVRRDEMERLKRARGNKS